MIDTYENIYFDAKSDASYKAQNLINLMEKAQLTELTCIEELVNKLLGREVIDNRMMLSILSRFTDVSKERQGTLS